MLTKKKILSTVVAFWGMVCGVLVPGIIKVRKAEDGGGEILKDDLYGLQFTKEEVNRPSLASSSGDSTSYDVTTKDGNKITFALKDAASYVGGVFSLLPGGTFGNDWLEERTHHNAISGLAQLLVHYDGGPLTLSYGYGASLPLAGYVVTGEKIDNGVVYDFNEDAPSYFSLSVPSFGSSVAKIQSISLTYSCSPETEEIPVSGYDITSVGEDPTTHVANTLQEAAYELELAIVRHYSQVSIEFAFDNTCDIDTFVPFYLTLDNYYGLGLTEPYETGVDKTYTFVIDYEAGKGTASIHTPPTEDNTYVDVVNAARELRLASQTRRPNGFDDFHIDNHNNGDLEVCNSQELWWAVAHGFKPVFPEYLTKAEIFYDVAKDILRNNINDGMDEYAKLRAIYEWIIAMTRYDHDAAGAEEEDWTKNTAFYLEGVFEHHTAVCDAFSKTFVLLAGIEGLDAIRGAGFPIIDGEIAAGHAWNYARLGPEEPYYLICPTWGQCDQSLGEIGPVSFADYNAFMTKQTFFHERSGNEPKADFTECLNDDKTLSDAAYTPSPWDMDKLPGSISDYDYEISTQDEMDAVVKAAFTLCGNTPFSLQLAAGDDQIAEEMPGMFATACSKVPAGTSGLQHFIPINTSFDGTSSYIYYVLQ